MPGERPWSRVAVRFPEQNNVPGHLFLTDRRLMFEYREKVLSIDARSPSRERSRETVKPERPKNERRTPLKQRIAEAEAEIERINGIIAKIDTALALPDLFTRDPKQAAQLSKARAGAESALRRAEEDWLEASAEFDEAAS